MKVDSTEPARLPGAMDLAQSIVETLLANSFELSEERAGNGDAIARIVPSNPDAAPIRLHCDGGVVYDVCLGEGTWFEVNRGDKYFLLNGTAAEEVRAICSAVFAGAFEETVWRMGKKITKARGTLTVEGKTHLVGSTDLLSALFGWRKTVKRYSPY